MGIKEDAKNWTVKEQIIEDPASGLTIQFEVVSNDEESPFRLRLFGDLPYGNRELLFSCDGKKTGGGTLLAGLCKPTWLNAPEE